MSDREVPQAFAHRLAELIGSVSFIGLLIVFPAMAAPDSGHAASQNETEYSDAAKHLPLCQSVAGSGNRHSQQSSDNLLVLTTEGDLGLANGDGVRLGDIHFADHLPAVTDQDRDRIRIRRTNVFLAEINNRALVACALSPEQDRYGRRLIDATGSGTPFSLRRHLVAEGLALVLPTSPDDLCCAKLYRAEARARMLGKGIWSTETPLIRRIDPRTGTVELPLSAFAIVEGFVRSVGDRERDIYLNFGHRWVSDFTATINKRRFHGSRSDLDRLADLTGKRVRVRGVSDNWQGGRIHIMRANQIEVLTPFRQPGGARIWKGRER